MSRVVADTNVLVSAIRFGGKPKQLLDLAADGHIDLTISEPILEETLRVLRARGSGTPQSQAGGTWGREHELRRIPSRVTGPVARVERVARPRQAGPVDRAE